MVPVLHGKVEFAVEVRRHFQEFRPHHVAVEYPDTLGERILQAVRRLPYLSVVHYEEADGAFVYLPIEPADGQVESVRVAVGSGIPVHFVDRDMEGYGRDLSVMPDSYAVKRVGHYAYCKAFLEIARSRIRSKEDELREKTMAYRLQRLNDTGERILFVGGLYHLPGLLEALDEPQVQVIGRRRREGVEIAHLHRESSREIMSEIPFLSATYERARSEGDWQGLDRLEVMVRLIRVAQEKYWENSKERLNRSQFRVLNRFARNYALVTGRLAPNFYQLVVAARGAAGDDFAYEIWDAGSDYPWQTEEPGLPVLKLSGEDLLLDRKLIRFHRRLKSTRRRLVPVPVRKKPREAYPGEWREKFKGHAICSYPPEDVVVEGYGHYLKKKAIEIKTQENHRVEPFVSSLLDGLDIRETVRNWGSGKIYVREDRPLRGKVGSVVVIFDPDYRDPEGKERFPWRVTWLGEHSQESDMAFYSTPAGEVMDGPGISRCLYGGFMLTYPPMRVYDIWKDPYFRFARNKPERLLMAALDYSQEKHVVYVSPTPPSGWCQSIAARLGRKIIYIPVGVLSPVTLKKIRQFHVLDGHHVRIYARQFI